MIEIDSYHTLESAQNCLLSKIFNFYECPLYKNLTYDEENNFLKLIGDFNRNEYKFTLIESENRDEIQNILKAFILYVCIKNYNIIYISKENDENKFFEFKKEFLSYYPCKINICNVENFVDIYLGKIYNNTILIFDDVDFYTVNKYMDTSMFEISPFILATNIVTL